MESGRVIWITGLSGSGKTTLAHAVRVGLPAASVLLDGDALRAVLAVENSGFDRNSRQNLAFTYARLCKMLAEQGLTVVIATISLFHALHDWNRANLPNYLEVFLDVPEDIRRARDPKGFYARQTPDMAGHQTQADFPQNPDLTFGPDTPVEASARAILQAIRA